MPGSGLGVTAEISKIEWIAENDRYPAEPRYMGELRTFAGKCFPFVTDIPIQPGHGNQEIVGRLHSERERIVIEISEVLALPP